MHTIIRKDISRIQAYQPGKPIEEVKRELGLKNVIKLASNENALGPSPRAIKAILKAASSLHRYPQGDCFYLKESLARHLGMDSSHLMFGNGSDELIDIILKTIHGPSAEIITADITFVEYEITAFINGFKVKTIPLKNFKFDLKAIEKAVSKNTKAIFIANPNNPTGTYLNKDEIASFLKNIPKDILVVFDEAYFEYADKADFPSLIPLITKNKNIIVLRTFSKIYGLAGVRIGYMIAPKFFIRAAERIRQPFNVNALAQAAALEALKDKVFLEKTRQLNKKEKMFLYQELDKLGLTSVPSAANFILVRFHTNVSTIFQRLLKKGVIIRPMNAYKLSAYGRITIGTRAENIRLLQTLKNVLRENKK